MKVFLTDLSFKEDYAISEQKQDLLFFDGPWEIWMVCYMSGREMICDFPGIIIFGHFQRGTKRGERGFCPREDDPANPDEVAWPNATEVANIFVNTQIHRN